MIGRVMAGAVIALAIFMLLDRSEVDAKSIEQRYRYSRYFSRPETLEAFAERFRRWYPIERRIVGILFLVAGIVQLLRL
jgi:hypothetical protein